MKQSYSYIRIELKSTQKENSATMVVTCKSNEEHFLSIAVELI